MAGGLQDFASVQVVKESIMEDDEMAWSLAQDHAQSKQGPP